MTSPSPWCDLSLRKTLRSAGRAFDLDVQIQATHRRIALMGPSGIGKTIVLQLIAGLIRPDHGHVSLCGQTLFDSTNAIDLPTQARRVGYLFQNYALLPHLTALGNVGFGLRRGVWGFLTRDQKAQARHWLDRFQLGHLAHQRPYTLSGGQQQRLGLARLAILKPRVLLLDEPFSALDPHLRQTMREELAKLLNTLDIPLLMVSHDEEDRQALDAQAVRLGSVNGRTVSL